VQQQFQWDQALIEKYNYSGPRYTSYPTAVEFTEALGFERLVQAAGQHPQRHLSLYVHIPFCHKLCYFCACNKVVTRHKHKAEQYLEYLYREIGRMAPLFAGRCVTQLHWGGGTPTFLSGEQISKLMACLRSHFRFADEAEISIEIDPREFELETLERLRKEGFNRISLGVQDFNKAVQRAVNREQDEGFIARLLERARKLGFHSTNLDLIYGLPLQTPESFDYTLEKVIGLDPARLSIFNYAHLPSLFAAQSKLKEAQLPSARDKLAILQGTIARLTEAGYQFIGMDHFAKPDDELAVAQRQGLLHRNFQGYTTQGDTDLLGLGVSAISQIGDCYSQNQKSLKAYYQQLDELGHAQWRGVALAPDDFVRRAVIKQLICNFRLDKGAIEREFGICFDSYFREDLALLAPMVADALVMVDADRIEVQPVGRLLIRNICMCFDKYMRDKLKHNFSRVI